MNATFTSVIDGHADSIVARYLEGESMAALARVYYCDAGTVRRLLIRQRVYQPANRHSDRDIPQIVLDVLTALKAQQRKAD